MDKIEGPTKESKNEKKIETPHLPTTREISTILSYKICTSSILSPCIVGLNITSDMETSGLFPTTTRNKNIKFSIGSIFSPSFF